MKKTMPEEAYTASAPCRVDLGGTLDLPLFYHTLGPDLACTFNMALNLRTRVTLTPFKKGRVKVLSRGFAPAEFASGKAPYSHPLGLVFAILDAFGAGDLCVEIVSDSPPRSALGGSSVVAVVLTALLMRIQSSEKQGLKAADIALCARDLESAVAGVPCGLQDQLAAAFGGVHLWFWNGAGGAYPWEQTSLVEPVSYDRLRDSMLLVYCGEPHDSLAINGRWVQGFREGRTRKEWEDIGVLTRHFGEAVSRLHFPDAVLLMKEELKIRLALTPEVLDSAGQRFAAEAEKLDCGVRFCGAGGGGCLWALGEPDRIASLRRKWEAVASGIPGAMLLDAAPEKDGILFEFL